MSTNALHIKFRYKDIRFLGFQTTDEANKLTEPIDQSLYEYQFNVGYKTIQEEKLIEITVEVLINHKITETDKVKLGEIRALSVFWIDNFSEVATTAENGEILIPEQFLSTIAGLAISSTRGMLVSCAAGSIVRNAIIPIINPNILLPPKAN